jgi:prolyl-tRNA synthetase
MMKNYLESYRDLPAHVYQFQTKLRNELRAKSGIMRGREFVMKDSYSYNVSEEAHQLFYERMKEIYLRVFERVGLGDRTYLTFASGGAFTQFSHEFQTLCDAGEDVIYVHREKKIAVNKEVLTDEVLAQLGVARDELEEVAAAEVGNIFSFGDVKSRQLGLFYKDESGAEQPVILGSYGIGITRLMGVLVEVLGDEKGLVWPESVAPFSIHLVSLGAHNSEVHKEAGELYRDLREHGIDILWDDRDLRAGEKFADSDLIGIPVRVVISEKTLSEGKFECVHRASEKTEFLTASDLLQKYSSHHG